MAIALSPNANVSGRDPAMDDGALSDNSATRRGRKSRGGPGWPVTPNVVARRAKWLVRSAFLPATPKSA